MTAGDWRTIEYLSDQYGDALVKRDSTAKITPPTWRLDEVLCESPDGCGQFRYLVKGSCRHLNSADKSGESRSNGLVEENTRPFDTSIRLSEEGFRLRAGLDVDDTLPEKRSPVPVRTRLQINVSRDTPSPATLTHCRLSKLKRPLLTVKQRSNWLFRRFGRG